MVSEIFSGKCDEMFHVTIYDFYYHFIVIFYYHFYYCAMHFSAKRGIAIAYRLSVRPSD